jgi:hypothetical protein
MFDRFKRIGKGIAKTAIMATPQAQALKAIHKRLQDPTDDFGVVGDKGLLEMLEIIAAQKARIEEQAKKMAADRELLTEVAASSIEWDAGKYVTVQIDKDTWEAIRKDTQAPTPESPE